MDSALIRQTFLDYFKARGHHIVSSAPMVIKNDPSLMFTNAGMNQFKDFFLGNRKSADLRIANTQKCLRVSGKHNDLEEVGVDTYHHTMFEMLGNWSFGDYFKVDAIDWAYDLLVNVFGISPEDLYVTYFGGDKKEGLDPDDECLKLWGNYFPKERIMPFGKKDNFWEMGETGPCGPCTEIHVDIRSAEEKKKKSALELVNASHPHVIEIWNLVFIQYNRNKDQSLTPLPLKHVDTGMGFERLAMVLQKKKSNYDTDVFMPIIAGLEKKCGLKYGHSDSKQDVAFRVIVDHLRAVSISIAEGQLPSNTGSGYVIRRILRRAIRYAYSYLNAKKPLINELLPFLDESLGQTFPEIRSQAALVQKVIHEEEVSFLSTLEKGIERFEKYMKSNAGAKEIDGKFAFELYDTYGFPLDLTELMAAEGGVKGGVNKADFEKYLHEQKERSRAATKTDASDWVVLIDDPTEEFVGYDQLDAEVKITRYRSVKQKDKELYQIIFNITPFYAEGGGQVGDSGYIEGKGEKISIVDTKKEGNVTIHIAKSLPKALGETFTAKVDKRKRLSTMKNHSATHLLHFALREILGDHVTQKGSLVHPDYLRFDFAHFAKISEEDLKKIERRVNDLIRAGDKLDENRNMPFSEARKAGAMALFGEKYGDVVRAVKFGQSLELCGGTHVSNTSQIGNFRIQSESSISAGIRRIEALTGEAADAFVEGEFSQLAELRSILKNPPVVVEALRKLMLEKKDLELKLSEFQQEQLRGIEGKVNQLVEKDPDSFFFEMEVKLSGEEMRTLIFNFIRKNSNKSLLIHCIESDRLSIALGLGDDLIKTSGLSAKSIISHITKDIRGGGGGQDQFATAGGSNISARASALTKIRNEIMAGVKKSSE